MRQKSGSTVCPECGSLVGVDADTCYNCGRRKPGMWGFAPLLRSFGGDLGFTKFAITTCALLFMGMLALSGEDMVNVFPFALLTPSEQAVRFFGASGYLPLYLDRQWWTILSAGWLHGNLLHIGFNLYWIHLLGPTISQLYGPARAALIYVVSSAAGFLITSTIYVVAIDFMPDVVRGLLAYFGLAGARMTLGASAAIFGWIGALVYYQRRAGGSQLRSYLVGFVLPLFLIGLFLRFVDNWAHLGGFAGGYLCAKWLDPLEKERGNHVLAAAIGVLVSLGGVALAVLSAVGG